MLLLKRLVLSLRDSEYFSILNIQNAFKLLKRSLKFGPEPWQGGIKPLVWLDQICSAVQQNCSGVCRNATLYTCPMKAVWNGLKIVPINHNLNHDCDRRLSSFSQNWSYYSIMASMAQWQSVVISAIICKHLTSVLLWRSSNHAVSFHLLEYSSWKAHHFPTFPNSEGKKSEVHFMRKKAIRIGHCSS